MASAPLTPRAPCELGDTRPAVAAVLLLAGTAADCGLTDRTAHRAAELARLDLHIAAPPPATEDAAGEDLHDEEAGSGDEAYDALRHTVTRDGDWPRCLECGEITALDTNRGRGTGVQGQAGSGFWAMRCSPILAAA